ncbi:hypothetical protein TSOC_001132 [Tetrabaena socialis]|uniref:Uncharacterized protein n=1 Tax=Tetrabaena socialis TaxID=47790 RepID=A0A2J8AHJ9_9CHLO|nr:hypothetical protein TSOC_001132 [Tetrabaena socialis]|eukprot:PNH11981.1 hypothetical protein TSOC_001132 [Tetrabaena socialis]
MTSIPGNTNVVDLTHVPGVADSCSEYVRLAQLAATNVPGSVEAERAFSTMSYIKNITNSATA